MPRRADPGSPAPRVVVAGELMLDVLFVSGEPGRGSGLYVRAGGSAANVARALASPSASTPASASPPPAVSILGRTGPDPNGAWIRARLEAAGVKVRLGPALSLPTGYVILHRRQRVDRVVYVGRGANRLLQWEREARRLDALSGAAWLHVSGYCLIEPGPAEAVRVLAGQARRAGVPVSLDPGLPRAFAGRHPDELAEILRLGLNGGPDVLLPSSAMTFFLARSPEAGDIRRASLALGRLFRCAVVKDGAAGAWVNGEKVGLEPGSERPRADVSGAGDVFDAGYIAATLEGAEPVEAARRANAAASAFVASCVGEGRRGSARSAGPGWSRVRHQEPPTLVSACLGGVRSAYDGRARWPAGGAGKTGAATVPAETPFPPPGEQVYLPLCPEQLGGLGTPRVPAEIRGEGGGEAVIRGAALVVDRDGRDVSDAFLKGARKAVELARATGAARALLSDGSPSCGVTRICDGTFGGERVPGQGVTAAALRRLGIEVLPGETPPGGATNPPPRPASPPAGRLGRCAPGILRP